MNMAKRNKSQRGATTKRQPRRLPSLPLRLLQNVLIAAILMSLLAGVVVGARWLFALPVDRVAVTGELVHVTREEIVERVGPALVNGFATIDIDEIRARLRELPWVMDVVVARKWPNHVAIHVIEQAPIARWGKNGLLNHRGEVFVPPKPVVRNDLPLLIGPENSAGRVVKNFRELGEVLGPHQLQLVRLTLDDRGSWSAVLNNDVVLMFGRDQLMARLQRFIRLYEATLKERFLDINKIDLRYSNGLAVAWRNAAAAPVR